MPNPASDIFHLDNFAANGDGTFVWMFPPPEDYDGCGYVLVTDEWGNVIAPATREAAERTNAIGGQATYMADPSVDDSFYLSCVEHVRQHVMRFQVDRILGEHYSARPE